MNIVGVNMIIQFDQQAHMRHPMWVTRETAEASRVWDAMVFRVMLILMTCDIWCITSVYFYLVQPKEFV